MPPEVADVSSPLSIVSCQLLNTKPRSCVCGSGVFCCSDVAGLSFDARTSGAFGPMILAAHVIFTAYGFWLPNDPRGSWSDFVRCWEIFTHGRATKTDERRSVAGRGHDAALRAAAKRALRYPPVVFNGRQAAAISYGFAEVVRRTGCLIYACAIMPDHVHLVIGRHRYSIQQVANLLKGGATRSLRQYNLDPLSPFSGGPQARAPLPSPWAHKCWKVWLDSVEDIERSITYVNENPIRQGLKPQRWKFITPYPF
jgi:REP element-mobilizing transposase RayT